MKRSFQRGLSVSREGLSESSFPPTPLPKKKKKNMVRHYPDDSKKTH
jgi:hypothetical protein